MQIWLTLNNAEWLKNRPCWWTSVFFFSLY